MRVWLLRVWGVVAGIGLWSCGLSPNVDIPSADDGLNGEIDSNDGGNLPGMDPDAGGHGGQGGAPTCNETSSGGTTDDEPLPTCEP